MEREKKWALIAETGSTKENIPQNFLANLRPAQLDIVLIEGFRNWKIPNIGLRYSNAFVDSHGQLNEASLALPTDNVNLTKETISILDINDHLAVVGFIMLFRHDSKTEK